MMMYKPMKIMKTIYLYNIKCDNLREGKEVVRTRIINVLDRSVGFALLQDL